MSNPVFDENDIVMVAFIAFIVGLCMFWFGITFFDYTYKDGQIDALTGKVRYQLVKNSRNESNWEKIQK